MSQRLLDDLQIAFIDKELADEAIIKELYQVTEAGFNSNSPWSIEHIRHTIESNSAIILVATLSDKKVGFIVASETTFELDIYMVVVAEKYQQQRIGTQLFNHLIEYAKEKNIESIVLETRASNVPAIALYERVGFFKVGDRKAYYSSPIEDATLMKHELRKEK